MAGEGSEASSPIGPGMNSPSGGAGRAGPLGRGAPASVTAQTLKSGGGGGTSGGMSDDWKNDVNTQLSRLHDDARKVLHWGFAIFVMLIGAFATGYMKISDQVLAVSVSQAKVETKLDSVDRTLQSVDSKLDRLLDERRSNPEPKR
jgi:hypothetical protein